MPQLKVGDIVIRQGYDSFISIILKQYNKFDDGQFADYCFFNRWYFGFIAQESLEGNIDQTHFVF